MRRGMVNPKHKVDGDHSRRHPRSRRYDTEEDSGSDRNRQERRTRNEEHNRYCDSRTSEAESRRSPRRASREKDRRSNTYSRKDDGTASRASKVIGPLKDDLDKLPKHNRNLSSSSEENTSKRHRTRRDRAYSPVSNFKPTVTTSASNADEQASDSDPLEAILGPLPPPPAPEVRSRGRGAFTAASGIDNHFKPGYDPSLDVRPDPDIEDDWDQALEALKDRQKWKQKGLERLRSAGFSEEELKRWEKGGEKDESDVRWAKKGESREWDRGKVIDVDGVVTLKAAWTSSNDDAFGRLKDDESFGRLV